MRSLLIGIFFFFLGLQNSPLGDVTVILNGYETKLKELFRSIYQIFHQKPISNKFHYSIGMIPLRYVNLFFEIKIQKIHIGR